MSDFVAYVVSELKSGRLSKVDALQFIRQFSGNSGNGNAAALIHPLLHSNSSDIYRQCYRSSFAGNEFFLADHQVATGDGESLEVLPGVAYLEMARTAVADAIPGIPSSAALELSEVVWLQPLYVTGQQDVFVGLTLGESADTTRVGVEFEVFSTQHTEEGRGKEVVHCRGRAAVGGGGSPAALDLESLQARIAARRLDASVIYPAYRAMGMQFGPAHQSVSYLSSGEREVLARLRLPATVSATLEQYQLHPSLMDGALQAAIGLLGDLSELPKRPSVPFALDELHIFSACKADMYAWIRESQAGRRSESVIRLDIDLCDEQGNVCVQIRGFSSRTLSSSSNANKPESRHETGVVLARPAWKQSIIANLPDTDDAQRHVLLCDMAETAPQRLRESLPGAQVLPVTAQSNDIAGRFLESSLACFEAVQAIVRGKSQGPAFMQVVIRDDADSRMLLALSGLLKSAVLESPNLSWQLLLVGGDIPALELAMLLETESRQSRNGVVRYERGIRQVLGLEELPVVTDTPVIVLKEQGVYLITGGLGGLGTVFSREILRQAKDARVILTGRAELSADIDARLAQIADGATQRIEYRALDVTDSAGVRALIADVKATYGRLNGIIHSAGMVADHLIAHKTAEEFTQVLAPKVWGAVNLDAASQDLELDFMVLFSSGAAVMGNVGQADYAVANGFLDQFAAYRNQLVAAAKRTGQTLAINWPLWQDGGMRMPAHNERAIRERTGMRAMQTGTGISAFYRSLQSGQSQTLVIEGQLEKIRNILFNEPAATRAEPRSESHAPVQSADAISEQAADYLRKQFSVVLKLASHKIDPHEPLEQYGIDSIVAMDLTSHLEHTFGSLPKTLFFEYRTIRDLADYFVREYPAKLSSLFGTTNRRGGEQRADDPAAEIIRTRDPATPLGRTRDGRRPSLHPSGAGQSKNAEPIAIVGLSGRYPESVDLDAYWQNLKNGKDCIVEVPRDRWDWRQYYSEDRAAPGSHYSKWGGFISGVHEFDPLFFNIPPVDAELIDPQERLFLQHVWMAMEDAGCTRASLQTPHDRDLPGQVGVYVGVMYGEYQLFGAEAAARGRRMGVPVSYASIANRVSYILNVHGPSMALDTMCSSSLTAIHLACQDLHLGRTSLAIAGGVNVSVHPNKYLILSSGQYISSDGHCQSFGAGGDGYIPGEGVGVVILKRLSDAQRDGNHIYGLIKGSALNHGGKTNGYTVPNLPAQASVIGRALQECNVDARHVSYIEAHGTGTKLGDPIEIAALTHAFRRYTQDNQFCLVGSAKSNVGHCESAAGIAGLTKVLLQMKHQLVAPSLHSATLNPHIDFEKSPFVVNQTLRNWEQPAVNGRRVPRIAGISSFGAGGSNAHLIVEEYTAPRVEPADCHEQLIFPLSARTPEQLKQKARDLVAFIQRQEQPIDLPSIAYTLQVGREAMDLRVGVLATSVAQLVEKLEAYSHGQHDIDDLFQGRVAKDQEGIAVLSRDEDMVEAIEKWIARGKFSKLVDLWVKGLEVDWRKLYGERKPRFCSLPTYPFAKERYWIAPETRGTEVCAAAAVLHPLCHTNTSDFHQQSYSAAFVGDEFFLTDHRIDAGDGGKVKVLPAVAYLEMVRAAVELALPGPEPRSLQFYNTAWAQPLIVNEKRTVAVSLLPGDDTQVDFEVSSGAGLDEPATHCRGAVTLGAEDRPACRDIQALRARMTRGALKPEEIYSSYQKMGIHYGPAFQCVTLVHRGQEELLAELTADDQAGERFKGYVLHPGLADSALQASIGLLESLQFLPPRPSIPFALDCLKVFAPCSVRMFAWVRRAAAGQSGSDVTKIDIDLCDQEGNVCAQFVGLAARTLGEPEKKIGSLLARPSWETSAIDVAAAERVLKYPRHVVVLCNLPHIDVGQLTTLVPGVEVESLNLSDTVNIAERYRDAAVRSFALLQSLLKASSSDKVLCQVVVGHAREDVLLAGLTGLVRSARLENPNLIGQVILSDAAVDEHALALRLRAAQLRSAESLIKYEQENLSVPRWQSEVLPATEHIAFRKQGVYIITGGLGGLGSLFAREILSRAQGARIILTGRSELNAQKWSAIAELAASASVSPEQLVYRQLDLTRREAVAQLVADIVEDFGGIQGVIHSAGMIQDRLIINKTQGEFVDVLAPKVAGTVNLDQATRDVDLDFLVLFSSVAAALGNAGQSDYAAANGFLDEFASYRNELVKQGSRRGRTLSINWPLWEEGGMQLDPETRDLLAKSIGITPLKTDTGMCALQRSLELQADRTLILEGDVRRLGQLLAPKASVAPVAALAARSTADGDTSAAVDPFAGGTTNVGATANVDPTAPDAIYASELVVRTQQFLCQQLASVLKLPANEVDPKAPLETYGIDSVLAMKLTSRLEQIFGSLSKTLLFEYQTIASLAGYLVKTFPRIVQERTGVEAGHARSVVQAGHVRPNVPVPSSQTPGTLMPAPAGKSRFIRSDKRSPERDVAIIGVSGRYPLASNLDAFWENLKNGRDCVTEIPGERWDYRQFYHPERNQPGKSYSKWGGFIDGVDQFDALFFNISPREAELIDPQERLFLETVWETIEDAGYSKDAIARNRVGVFVGVMWGQYELFGAAPTRTGTPNSSFASIANRISYFFNFQGPSLALDTMCSSSLTAIHLASEEIRKGSLDVAVAGGVNVSIHPNKYLNLSQGNFASTDGRCRSFGEGGNGYVPGEGVGAVLLKSLEQALADGDQVYAIIKASSINHGGKTNGYTVPNPLAQSAVIAETLQKAQIDSATLSYIETHGTGTSLGDPIEITGLLQAFDRASQPGTQRGTAGCRIGSVKSNIGHLESAAGIAALTKVLLQLKYRQLVPSLHAEPANPNINFADTPFQVQTKLEDWQPAPSHPRRAGVSSFGAGGSNAHLIIEEFVDPRGSASAPRQLSASAPERPQACVLSAKSRESLLAYAQKMLAFLERSPNLPLTEIAYTSQVGRTAMQERLVVVASSRATLQEKLSQWLQTTTGQPRQGLRHAAHSIEDVYEGSVKDSRSSAAVLLEGEAGKAFMRLTLESRDLRRLAQLWSAGVEIDWASLYGANRPRKVSLPTYPFARQRYWIESNIDAAIVAGSQRAEPMTLEARMSASDELLYYRPEWSSMETSGTDEVQGPGPLLILDTDDRLFEQLRRQDDNASVLVKPAEVFQQLQPNVFTLGLQSEADFLRLAEALRAKGSLPRTIVHHDAGGLDQGIYALHNLCKALLKQKTRDHVRIVSVRAGVGDEHSAMHAALAGFFKTLTLENPRFQGKVVEVCGAAATENIAALVRAELNETTWRSCEIRYLQPQPGSRQVRDLERYFPANQVAAGSAPKQGGVYLITGGLGGLGYIFSEYLAKQYHARLVLIGRSAPNADQQGRLAELAAYGHAPIYRQVDVTDRAEVEAVVREVRQTYARLDGIIHSAGIHRDSFILNKSAEEISSVLAAKVFGTINLDWATRDEPLDLFILFSSIAGALGNPGQSDYAFANNFMDAFAERRQRSRSGRTLSINWPFWEEGGMQLSRSDIELTAKHTGIVPLPTDRGIECFETLLQSECSQAIALQGVAAKVDHRVLHQSQDAVTTAHADALLDTGVLLERTVTYLQTLLSRETKLAADQIEPEERFDSFGVDSMMINRMNAVLEQDLGAMPKTLFYEYTTVEDLGTYLVQEAQSSLARHFKLPPASAVPGATTVPTATAVPGVTAPPSATAVPTPIAAPTATAAPRGRISAPASASDPIAIVGIHATFPHSENLEEFWENLQAGKDLIEPVPASRWNSQDFFDPDPEKAKGGKIYCTSGGFLEDFDKFDAAFFQISAEDARLMDPQERLFLQSAWAALEDAGYTRESLKQYFPKGTSADVGVFVGVTTNTYHLLASEEWSRGNMVTPGALPWSIANRVSYFFDFQGPSMPVDTACSSSLVAMHLACDSLRKGECQVALAGGVNLYLHVSKYQSFCRRRMLAVHGQCRSFGAGDDGFIPGEGVGTLVLKPLSKALEHRDHIYGVIAASSCEHSGRSHGYSAPNPNSQAELIAQTLRKANIHPETIGYIEGHGTGTQLGDSLEIASLTQAFKNYTGRKQFCSIGSVKANIGHSESAAGIAGVAKILLQLKHQQIAPTIHADVVNPDIDFEGSPVYLQHRLTPWKAVDGQPRRAMVNGFGAGGVNACLVLEEYRQHAQEETSTAKGSRHLVVLSARNSGGLQEVALRLKSFLSREQSVHMSRLAYTLQVGREAMAERLAVMASDAGELIRELDNCVAGKPSENIVRGRAENRRGKKAGKQNERDLAKSLYAKGELKALAQKWVSGEQLQWEDFHATPRPIRLPLPTYPFARERHWVSDTLAAQTPAVEAPVTEEHNSPREPVAQLHPLVTVNLSTLKETSFGSTLSTDRYYARDHRVNSEMFFPGAGFLEIACVNGTIAGEQKVTSIRDIVWSAPLRFSAPSRFVKTFLKASGDATEYVIVSFDEDNERVVHSEGRLLHAERGDPAGPGRHGGHSGYGAESAAPLTIQSLQARCSTTLDATQCYQKFARHGLQYGPTFQSIQELHVGADFALSKLKLADTLLADFEQYILHPCLLDGALQTVVGFAAAGEPDSPYVPFALDEVRILRPLAATCYALVELAASRRPDVRQFNISLLNESGALLVKLSNFYVRALRATRATHQPMLESS